MDDPFFGRFWDRYPQRRSHPSPYCSHPYPAAAVTPTKPEYEYRGAPKLKPKRFTVPVQGPPIHSSPCSSSVTQVNNPSKPSPNSSSGIKKAAAPLMDQTSAATRVQSAFRGFSARKSAPLKNLRVIRDAKAEAEAIRRRLADRQVVESILQNEKERLKLSEGIMSLLFKLDAIQGVNSFVRDSRKAMVRELLYLQEMVDAIIAGKSIEGRISMDAGDAEDDNHGDEMTASAEENGEACLERGPDKEIRDEEVLDEVKEEVSGLSHKIESRKMQIESPNHTEDKSMGMGGNGGGESTEVVASGEPMDLKENKLKDQELEQHDEPMDLKENKLKDQELEQHDEPMDLKENKLKDQELEQQDEEVMRDSLDDEKSTDGASSCKGLTGEELRALESHSMPCTDEEFNRHSMDEEESHSASDSEVHVCKRLKALDRSQAEAETIQADEQQSECEGMDCEETGKVDRSQADAETIQADEQQRQCEGMECEETGKVIEAGSVEGDIAKVEEDVVKVKDENERLKKTVADLFKKSEFQNELITNLSLRIAQLEQQISNSKRKKTGYRRNKTKETSPSP